MSVTDSQGIATRVGSRVSRRDFIKVCSAAAGAVGAPRILKDAGFGGPVVTLPGCPANPYNLLGTVLQLSTFGTLPRLDERGRPVFAYARTEEDRRGRSEARREGVRQCGSHGVIC
jgi:hydrogenase small subunit